MNFNYEKKISIFYILEIYQSFSYLIKSSIVKIIYLSYS